MVKVEWMKNVFCPRVQMASNTGSSPSILASYTPLTLLPNFNTGHLQYWLLAFNTDFPSSFTASQSQYWSTFVLCWTSSTAGWSELKSALAGSAAYLIGIVTANAAKCDLSSVCVNIVKEVCTFGSGCWMMFLRRWIVIERGVVVREAEEEERNGWILGWNR